MRRGSSRVRFRSPSGSANNGSAQSEGKVPGLDTSRRRRGIRHEAALGSWVNVRRFTDPVPRPSRPAVR
jgi:hypothetical protein